MGLYGIYKCMEKERMYIINDSYFWEQSGIRGGTKVYFYFIIIFSTSFHNEHVFIYHF